ncbi:MAG: hypothetical protein KKD18_02840, partial [Nanoarchaeota archaeon]|nr:hypothetical protein [Nanoarchaeota archaeon]
KYEKQVASMLDGIKQGLYGGEDVSAGPWSIEAKTRKKFVGDKWMEQAVKNCPEGKVPIVIEHTNGQRHSNDLVMMRLGDFKDWYGNPNKEILHGGRL